MAAACNVSVLMDFTGLGKDQSFAEKFAVTTTPARYTYIYQVQTTTNTAEALSIGDVATIELIIIKATSKALLVDSSFVSSFSSEEIIPEGEVRVLKPSGIVYIKNSVVGESCTLEAWIVGSA
jgi:hypothetical protein